MVLGLPYHHAALQLPYRCHTTTAHLHPHSPLASIWPAAAACHPLSTAQHDSHSAASSSHTLLAPLPASPPQLLTHSLPAHTSSPALIRRAQHSETPPAANPAVPVHSRGVCTPSSSRPLILTCILCVYSTIRCYGARRCCPFLCATRRARQPAIARPLAREHRITYARPPDRPRREVAAHTHSRSHPATTKQPSCCFSILPVSRQSQVRLLASTALVRLGLSEHGCLNASQRLKNL